MPPGFFSAIHSRTRAALFEWTMSKKIGFASALLVLDLRHELLSEPPHRRNILPCTAVRHACCRNYRIMQLCIMQRLRATERVRL